MAPLSRQLVGLILPYDKFGSHLNPSRKTINLELEKRNFAAAGKVLSELWSELVIDGYPVSANYVDPVEQQDMEMPSEEWRYRHVRQSQYTLQISKCDDMSCCFPKRSPDILHTKFLPEPVPFVKTPKGFIIDEKDGKFLTLGERLLLQKFVPEKTVMDSYCPSTKKVVQSRTCQCGFYSPSLKANKSHKESLCCIEGELSLSDFEEEDDEPLNVFEDLSITDKDEEFPILSYDTVSAHSIRFLPN